MRISEATLSGLMFVVSRHFYTNESTGEWCMYNNRDPFGFIQDVITELVIQNALLELRSK